MILAAPLVIPFAKAVGLSVGTLGMAALADKVNDYIEANPEESAMILKTLVPNLGIGEIFMKKEDKISLEDLDEMTDEEAQDLTKEEKAELMKQAGKRRDRELSIATSEKIGLSGPGKEKQDIEYEIDERYDEGGVEEKKAPFDYTKFFRKRRADGGAIGVESLFEERKNFRGGGTYQGRGGYGASRRRSTTAKAPPSMGFGNPPPGSGGSGGGGGGGGGRRTSTTTPTQSKNPFSKKNLQKHFVNNQLLADAVKKGILTNEEYNILGGYDATQTLGLGPLDTGLASLSYNVAQSVLGNQPFSDILGDVARNVKGATNISPELQVKYQNIIGRDLADGGRVGFNVGGITDPAALSIYNSMNAYGFSDQEIADAITAQGYDAGTLGQGPSIPTPVPVAPREGIIGIQLDEGGGGGGSFPIGQISDTSTGFAGTGLIGDFMAANEARNRKLVQPGKIAQFAYDRGFPKQRSVQEMIESGRIDTRRSAGMPFGISGLIAGVLPDRYFDMSLGDQVFTQSQMGYDGPTVFGNQGNIGNKDPFGINVRSAFGNYADYVTNRVSELEEALEKAQKKYGGLTDEYFNMTKYMRNELKFRKAQEQVKEDQARRIEEARQNRIVEERKAGRIANQQMQRQEGGGGGGNLSRSLGISKQAAADISEANRKAGMGGFGLKDGGLASMFVEKR